MKKTTLKKKGKPHFYYLHGNMRIKLMGLIMILCSYSISSASTIINETDLTEKGNLIQSNTITGTVVDTNNVPLLGASILEKISIIKSCSKAVFV